MTGLKDLTVVLTGVSSGIGQATAQLLNEQGARIIGLDIKAPTVAVAQYIHCDIGDEASINAAAQEIDGPLNALINVAGVPGSWPKETVIRINFLGLRLLSELLVPKIIDGGSITNVASIAGAGWQANMPEVMRLVGTPDFASGVDWIRDTEMTDARSYNFSKECVIVLTKVMAKLRLSNGIRVNSVSPGVVNTPILADFRASMGSEQIDWAEQAVGRNALPDDLAPAIVSAADPAMRWMNGADIQIDGGLMAGLIGGWVG